MTPYATIFYLPPPGWGCVQTFVDNLNAQPPSGRTIVISEHDWKSKLQFKHEFQVLMGSPENLRQRELNPTCGISNCLFAVAMRVCKERNVTHALYLEADCRVRSGFDAVLFDEYFSSNRSLVCAGSMVSWNAANGGLEYLRRLADMISACRDYPTPVMTLGTFPWNAKPCNPSLFPNGAGGIYNVTWMHELFGKFENLMAFGTGEGMEGKAFDYQIGEKLRQKFGVQSFDVMAHLKSVCSTYGDYATTAEQRLDLLRTGKVVLAHQFKGKETI